MRRSVASDIAGLQVDVANSVVTIGEERWNALAQRAGVPDYAYISALEKSGLAFRPLYAVAWDSHGPRGIMFGGLWHLRFARALRLRVFTAGSPLNVGVPLLLVDHDEGGVVTAALAAALRDRAGRQGARLFVVRDFTQARQPGFSALSMLYDCALLDIAWESFEAYVQSRPKRKSIRRDLKAIAGSGFRLDVRSGTGLSGMEVARVHALWLQLYRKHRSFDQLYVTERFFSNCALLPHAIYFLLYREGRLVAFDLCFGRGDVLESTYCGVDLAATGRLPVHRAMGYEIVRHAIEHRYRRINFGISNAAVKQEAGCRMEPLYGQIALLPGWLDRACGDVVRRWLSGMLRG